MLRFILIGLLFAIAACGRPAVNTTPVKSPSSLVAHMGNSTAGLVIKVNGLNRVYCTAVWVKEDVLLTANHCVSAAAKMNHKILEAEKGKKPVDDDDDEEDVDAIGEPISYVVESEVTGVSSEPSAVHLGKVVATDDSHDLALVRVVKGGVPKHSIAALSDEMPGLGEHVYIVGHVKGLWWSYIEGVVSAYRKELPGIDKSGPFVQVSGPVYYGNSGGGLYDSSGRLVGICSFMSRAPQTNFFIHLDSIKKFMKESL
jgi:hypothetical protein